MDSFDIINLVTEIADAYDVVVNAKYIVPKNFNSAKAIYAMIKEIEDEQ